jgi:transcriptional regulator with XRE-family HTH domain
VDRADINRDRLAPGVARALTLSSLLDIMSSMRENLAVRHKAAKDPAPDINARIASRVRALRAGLNLSLDALAAKSQVSRSMLSLVERGEASPTAVVLERIASGLGAPLASLFDDDAAPADPVSRGAQRTVWRDPQSGYVRRNVSPPGYPSPLRIVEVMLPAGARVAYESAAREANIHQQIWVLEGTLDISVGGVAHRLQADDCLAMRLDQPMTFRNRTRKATRYVVVIATEPPRAARR